MNTHENLKAALAKAEAEMYAANYVAMSVQTDNASGHEHIEQALQYASMCEDQVRILREAVASMPATTNADDKCSQCGLTFDEAADQCDRCFTRGADFY